MRHTLRLLLVFLVLPSWIGSVSAQDGSVSAQDGSPEAVAQAYLEAVNAGELKVATALVAPEDLHEVKRIYGLMLDDHRRTPVGNRNYGTLIIQILLDIETSEELQNVGPAEIFRVVMSLLPAEVLSEDSKAEVLGIVYEDEDHAYAVSRTTLFHKDLPTASMDLVSLRRAEDGWRVRIPLEVRSDLAREEAIVHDSLGE